MLPRISDYSSPSGGVIKLQNAAIKESHIKRFSGPRLRYFENCVSDRFSFKFDGTTLIVTDLFLGSVTSLIASFDISRIKCYVPVSETRGFLGFSTNSSRTGPTKVAIVLLDFCNAVYSFCDERIEFAETCSPNFGVCYSAEHRQVALRYSHSAEQPKIRIFKLDCSLSIIESHRVVEIPKNALYFKFLDKDRLVCMNKYAHQYNHVVFIDGFTLINSDGSSTKLKNTQVRLDARFPVKVEKNEHFHITSEDGYWHEERFFYFFNLVHGIFVKLPSPVYLPSIPHVFLFDLKTSTWSELQLNYAPGKYWYGFNVNGAGILNILNYGGSEIGTHNEEPLFEYELTLSAFPLRNPDKLLNLTFFEARSKNISANVLKSVFKFVWD